MSSTPHILICDDDPIVHESLRLYLDNDHYTHSDAFDGLESLNLAKEDKPDLILLDVMMPQMNGYDFLKVFNEKGWDKKVPVIVVTASDDEETFEKCRELGIKFFIRKPYTFKEASGVIESAIKSFKKK